MDLQAIARCGERQHAPELTCRRGCRACRRARSRRSSLVEGLSATESVWRRRQASSRSARSVSVNASTAAARSAALTAPARPIASVPTGIPAGIWTIDNRLSCPDSALDSTGTPNTGSGVIAAVMPGRCAAPPAPAMTTLKPAAFAPFAKAYEPVRGAMGRDDPGVIGHAEQAERLRGMAHGGPVGLASHDDRHVRQPAHSRLPTSPDRRAMNRRPMTIGTDFAPLISSSWRKTCESREQIS